MRLCRGRKKTAGRRFSGMMPLRVAAQKRTDCGPLLTLHNQRRSTSGLPLLIAAGGLRIRRQHDFRHTGKLNLANRRKIRMTFRLQDSKKLHPAVSLNQNFDYSRTNRPALQSAQRDHSCLSEDSSPSPPNDLQAGIHKGAASEPLCAPRRVGA